MVSNDLALQEDIHLRWNKIQLLLKECDADACLIGTSVNLYYTTGAIYSGYLYLPSEGSPHLFIKRPSGLNVSYISYIKKPELIPALLNELDYKFPKKIMLEMDELSYNEVIRLCSIFKGASFGNATSILHSARITKTPWEIDQFRISAKHHSSTYSKIKKCFYPGITDIEFQYNLERECRASGSLGIFRGFGPSMDIFMGSVLCGENAERPSPFDFALGGEGLHPSLPIGANGSIIKKGTTVMVDMAGNYTAYISDMTRVFRYGELPAIAMKAHQTALAIQDYLECSARPGSSCAEIYTDALNIVEKAGLSSFFMGTTQQAKFIGHGIGLQINERPVFTSRSKEVLMPNMVFAFEPKFVIPGVGAVGIENSYLVSDDGVEKLTVFEEGIMSLD